MKTRTFMSFGETYVTTLNFNTETTPEAKLDAVVNVLEKYVAQDIGKFSGRMSETKVEIFELHRRSQVVH